MTRINSVRATAFRGLRDDTVEAGGGSVVLYGENGTGKSSIIDAIEYFFTGSIEHLERSQATSVKRHGPHILCNPADLSVSITFRGFAKPLTRTLEEDPVVPSGLRDLMERLADQRFILRRAQLLTFIMAQDAPRYQQLAGLIGADRFDQIERAWKDAADTTDAECAVAEANCRTHLDQLTKVVGPITATTKNDIVDAINRRLSTLGEPPIADLQDAEGRRGAVLGTTRHKENAEASARLKGIGDLGDRLLQQASALPAHKSFWQDVDNLQADVERIRVSRLTALLRSAKEILSADETAACPVCEQPVDHARLLEDITARILQGEEATATVAALVRQRNAIREQLRLLREDLGRMEGALAETPDLTGHRGTVATAAEHCAALIQHLEGDVLTLSPLSYEDAAEAPEFKSLASTLMTVIERCKEQRASLSATAEDMRVVEVIAVLSQAATSGLALLKAEVVARQARAAQHSTRRIYDLLIQSKKNCVQAIYDALEHDITRLYHAVHPQEPHGQVKLSVSATRRGSAAIRTAFGDRTDVDPRAYNSEAHLDSLGLCIFLAFAQHFSQDVPYLVLDDVVSSVDAAHRTRICQLLFREFPDHQLIITTHDALWFEEILSNARALKFGPLCARRILGWSLTDGPRWAGYATLWDQMRDKAREGDKQGAGSLARHTLEGFLFQLAVNLEAPVVPRSDARYDVGSLLDPVLNRARKLIPGFETAYHLQLTQFRATSLLANLLTHNNLIAANTSQQEVLDFVDAVQAIHGIFHCPNCDQLIRYFRDAKVLKCQCTSGGKHWAIS